MNMNNRASPISNTMPTGRPVGSTELTLCKALAGGTGVTVVCLQFSKHHDTSTVQDILCHLQQAHPILRSKLRYLPAMKTYSFVTHSAPFVKVRLRVFDAEVTSTSSKLVQIAENEVNEDMWVKIHSSTNDDVDVFTARIYKTENGRSVVALRFLTAVLDLTGAKSLIKEFLVKLSGHEVMTQTRTQRSSNEICVVIEDLNPKKTCRSVWSAGKSLLSTTVTSVGLTNLSFIDTKSLPRCSRIIQLELDQHQTRNLLEDCKSRGIKLFGALAAAGMIAAQSANTSRNTDNFGVVTVFDCRSSLNPPLSTTDIGFYSTGVLTSHSVSKTESFWNLAEKTYATFTKLKNTNKHFTDMALANYLMCKAIENPGLTPSSSQRTSLLSIVEETLVMEEDWLSDEVGLEDFVICPSGHGVGPSISIVDAVHNSQLKCTISYPSPLHSSDQIVNIVEKMKNILAKATPS